MTERVLDRLIADGVVTPAIQHKRRAGSPTKATGSVATTPFTSPPGCATLTSLDRR